MLFKKLILLGWHLLLFCLILLSSAGFTQQDVLNKNLYQIGPDEKLLISVHIWGEVRQPGEYFVTDDTDVLELISKAGGPTEYANLNNVKISRRIKRMTDLKRNRFQKISAVDEKFTLDIYTKVIKVELKSLLDIEKDNATLPTLQPGDVVRISRNTWFKWQTILHVMSQIAILLQAWYWYNRAS